MKLTTTQRAPEFSLIDIFDRKINLEDNRRKRIFIGFFRHAGCPFCNLRVHALTKVHSELKQKGMEMIFFFESKKEVLLRSMFHKEVSPIPLIADPEKKIYAAYGLEESKSIAIKSHLTTFVQTAFKASRAGVPVHLMASGESFNTIPAEFLIDYDLVIKKVHYAQALNDRLSLDLVKHFAETGEVILPENL
jgi:thioredoxin-dependent peroxiredoxin